MAKPINSMTVVAINWSIKAMETLKESLADASPAQVGQNWAQLRNYINHEISQTKGAK